MGSGTNGISVLLVFYLALAQPAQGGALTTLDGEPRDLAEFVGKGSWIIVTFWASDCSICNRDAHELVALHAAHRDRGIDVLGISTDGTGRIEDAKQFIERNRLNYPNLITDSGNAARIYYTAAQGKFVGTPTFLVYSPGGRLLAKQFGTVSREQLERFIERAEQRGLTSR